jgi:predicted aspartyl protease
LKASFAYDTEFDPAAPVLLIGISPSGEVAPRQEVTALVDTGSDVSMLPASLLVQAGCRYVDQARLRGIYGEAQVVNLYLCAIHVSGIVVHGVRAVGAKELTEAILGRDVLNQLELTLNGPAQELWVQ